MLRPNCDPLHRERLPWLPEVHEKGKTKGRHQRCSADDMEADEPDALKAWAEKR